METQMTQRLIGFTRRLVLAGVAALGLGSAAKADVVATFTGTAPFTTASTNAFGGVIDGMPVGTFNYTVVSSTDPRFSGSFQSFCADYFQPVTTGDTYTYTPVAISALPDVGTDPTKLARIQELYDRYYNSATNSNGDQAGAFQLALWELLYDGTGALDIGSGNFIASALNGSTNAAIAQSWLNSLDDPNLPAPVDNFQLVGLFNANNQDQIVPFNAPSPVPAPAALVLAVIGGGVLLARRRAARKVEAEATA
jgi:hypothetical protein